MQLAAPPQTEQFNLQTEVCRVPSVDSFSRSKKQQQQIYDGNRRRMHHMFSLYIHY